MIPDDSNPAYRRIRFYQDQLDGLLDIHPDHNNLMISTWLNRWGMEPLTYEEGEEEKSTMKLGINGPEFCGGHIPLDNDPPATYTDENWRDKFLKDGSADFISNLQGNYNGSKVKVLGIHNVYLTDYGIQKGLSNYTAPSNLDTEIILNSWPFNYPVREKITEHFIGIENGETGERVTGQLRFDWGSSNVNGSNTTNIPFWNCNINAANVLGMDYKVGRSWPGHPDIDLNLRRGITDSIIGPQNQGFPGADGTYTAMGGSVAFKPCYVGFDGLSGEKGDQVFYDMRSGQYISMPPGGGSFAYRAGEQILSKLEDDPGANGEPFFLNEGFGSCYMNKYDVVYLNSWPLRDLRVGGSSSPAGKFQSDMRIAIEETKENVVTTIDGKWIPFNQLIAHEHMIFEDGLDWFPPRQYWHTELSGFGIQNRFYGASTDSVLPDHIARQWLAFNADMAYSFTFGFRMGMYDVDVGIRENGVPYNFDDNGGEDVVNLFNENFEPDEPDPYYSKEFFKDLLGYYKFHGFPVLDDKVSEGLFFGKLLKIPEISNDTPPDFDKSIIYDTKAGLEPEQVNISLSSPAVIHSLWEHEFESMGKFHHRLLMVFTNFTSQKIYSVITEPVNLDDYFDVANFDLYSFYYNNRKPGDLQPPPKRIKNTSSFSFSAQVKPLSAVMQGILSRASGGIIPPIGKYTVLDDDSNLDLIFIDPDDNSSLKVVFGDGSMDYDENNAVVIADNIKDFGAIISEDGRKTDLVALTPDGMKIFTCIDNDDFAVTAQLDGAFLDASKMESLDYQNGKLFIVKDGPELQKVKINRTPGEKEPISFGVYPLSCGLVRNFEVGYLSEDDVCDLAVISEDGELELLTFRNEIPEQVIIYEIGTDKDKIEFEDTDADTDMDIVLGYEGDRGQKGEDVLTNMGEWKFAE